MGRETIKARNARVGSLLAEFDSVNGQLRKLEKMAKDLKEQVREIEPGAYGEWVLSHGTPREILDQRAARELIKGLGAVVPTTMTEAPLVVRPAQ